MPNTIEQSNNLTIQQPMTVTYATIISIGDEILIGQITNTNATWMATELNAIGVKVHEIITIADTNQAIQEAVSRAFTTSDILLLTGGLGPTKDDVTKLALAQFFDAKLELNEQIWADIKGYLTARGRTSILENVKTMAMLPDKCTVIRNHKGTAAAMWFDHHGKVLVSMPGVPHEMKDFMSRIVLTKIAAQFQLPTIIHRTLKCVGLGESMVANKIVAIEDNLPPYIKLAYLPGMGVLRLRLSAWGNDTEALRTEVDQWVAKIEERLAPKYLYGYEKDTIHQVIGKMLVEKGATVGTAESCTGGLIAHKFTSVSGSSAYFHGGVVAYSNDLKMRLLGVQEATLIEHGAVSEATVLEMAKGTIEKLGVDYSIAVSGIAGPTGGTKLKPVGTVWIAVASKERAVAKKYAFPTTRTTNILLSANVALGLLRRLLLGLI